MTLEELIEDTAARGELVHLFVSANISGKGFAAGYGPASGFGITTVSDASPSKALRRAIEETKLRKRRAPIRHGMLEEPAAEGNHE